MAQCKGVRNKHVQELGAAAVNTHHSSRTKVLISQFLDFFPCMIQAMLENTGWGGIAVPVACPPNPEGKGGKGTAPPVCFVPLTCPGALSGAG